MEKFNIIALITFHENIDCLNDQVTNILKFNEKCCIVINSGYEGDLEEFKEKWKDSNVYIFERQVEHEYHDPMIPLHLECYFFMKEKELISDYVIMLSSNQLFIRSNIFRLMKKYSASYFQRPITRRDMYWIDKSKNFKKFRNILGEQNFTFQTNHDGMFLKYDIFQEMMQFFLEYYDMNDKFSRKTHLEEYVYPAYLLNVLQIKNMCPYSEYNYWPRDWDNPIVLPEFEEAFRQNMYIVKRVQRKINDPVRRTIRHIQIFEEKYE